MGYWTYKDFMDMAFYNEIKATKGLQEATVYETVVQIATRLMVAYRNQVSMKKPEEMVGYEKKEDVEAAITNLNTKILRFKNLYKGFEEVETKNGARTQAIETLRKDLANNNRWWESADPLVRAYYQLHRALTAFAPSEVANDVVSALGPAYAPRDEDERQQVAQQSVKSYQEGYFKRVNEALTLAFEKKYGSGSSMNR